MINLDLQGFGAFKSVLYLIIIIEFKFIVVCSVICGIQGSFYLVHSTIKRKNNFTFHCMTGIKISSIKPGT